ncbi:MAG TPA: ABC transporter ATP-binding protein [Thermoanaerobaculia bacterium]|jgi:ATP-binding cassette subfamily B protein
MTTILWPAERFEEAAAELGPARWKRLDLHGRGIDDALRHAAPALIQLEDGSFIALLDRRRVLCADLTTARADLRALRACIVAPAAARLGPEVAAFAPLQIEEAMLEERIDNERVASLWLLQTSPSSGLARQLRDAGVVARMIVLVLAHLAMILCLAASWWLLGAGALGGRMDGAWVMAWALVLLMTIPLQLVCTWSEGVLAAQIGGLLKQRLLDRAMVLDPDSVRSDGPGRFLGKVLEAEALETFAMGAGLSGMLTLIELGMAMIVLAGASTSAAAMLVLWIAAAVFAGWRYAKARAVWTQQRLTMTESLIESMAGHRTRLVQERPEQRAAHDDLRLAAYAADSLRLDRAHARLLVVIPRGWLILGVLSLLPLLWQSGQTAALAVGIGGVLLGHQGFRRGAEGMTQLAGAFIAWQQISGILQYGEAPAILSAAKDLPQSASVQVADVAYRFAGDEHMTLRRCGFDMAEGERALLEGDAGAGKSTLISLLAGMRVPAGGTVLVGGVDRHAAGAEEWRRRIAVAPQFQDNHILAAPLAFNLLMARNWPPSPADLGEADTVARELGLGALIDRMPGGLWQAVGDTGWQLSQGEKARVFVARALLQNTPVVVIDESFSSLDPENYASALACVSRRAKTLLMAAQR